MSSHNFMFPTIRNLDTNVLNPMKFSVVCSALPRLIICSTQYTITFSSAQKQIFSAQMKLLEVSQPLFAWISDM